MVVRCLLLCAFCALTFAPRATAQALPDPSTDWAAIEAEQKAKEAAFNAQAAAFAAQQKAYEAEAAAVKLKYGTVEGQTAIKGEVTMDETAGKPEAILLMNRSAQASAIAIYERVVGAVRARPNQDVLLLSSSADLGFADAIVFDLRVQQAETALDTAHARFEAAQRADRAAPADGESVDAGRAAALTSAGVIVDAVAKLGSYFNADYAFKGVKVDLESKVVTRALAGWLVASEPRRRIVFPDAYLATDARWLMAEMKRLNTKYALVVGEQGIAKQRATELADKPALAANYVAADTSGTAAIKLFEDLLTTLSAEGSADKDPFVIRVLRQRKALATLEHDPLILVVDGEGEAQYYTRKSLWNFWGGPKVYTAAGVSLYFSLTDAVSGQVLAAGAVAQHGGYQSLRKVERLFPLRTRPVAAGAR
jgi:hypothetical protein